MKTSIWDSWELYLLILGERSVDYAYTPEMIYKHLDYFRKGWSNHLSSYKALEMFSFELDKKFVCCGNWNEYGICKCKE